MSPRAEQLIQEERAKLNGETWPFINQESYDQIAVGSSYDDVVARLGPGEEASRTEMAGHSVVTYQWVRPDGGNINLTFRNGALVSKAQAGL